MTKLFVGSLSFSTTDESLLRLFTEKGYKPVSARIITDRETGRSRGFGFVELGPGDDAAKAIGEFNGLNVEGRALQVDVQRLRTMLTLFFFLLRDLVPSSLRSASKDPCSPPSTLGPGACRP